MHDKGFACRRHKGGRGGGGEAVVDVRGVGQPGGSGAGGEEMEERGEEKEKGKLCEGEQKRE